MVREIVSDSALLNCMVCVAVGSPNKRTMCKLHARSGMVAPNDAERGREGKQIGGTEAEASLLTALPTT